MKILDLEQGSDLWLSWRKTVITGTDCPAIRGSSPWSTGYKVWQRKLGLAEEQKSNEAMERGKRLEPIIRERFNRLHGGDGLRLIPAVVESSEYEFLGASLDGISYDGTVILEIKTGGKNLLDMAMDGIIPAYYMDQMQHQLLVTGAKACFYIVGSEREVDDITIVVHPDPSFAEAYLPVARDFWRCVAFGEPPALQDSDYKDMSNAPLWTEYARQYRGINEQIKSLEEAKESYRKELLALCADQNCSGAGIKVMKTIMRGRVAYDEIPEIKGIDLDKYRKKPITSWKIMTA
jgi:putative phage-type endonuclease